MLNAFLEQQKWAPLIKCQDIFWTFFLSKKSRQLRKDYGAILHTHLIRQPGSHFQSREPFLSWESRGRSKLTESGRSGELSTRKKPPHPTGLSGRLTGTPPVCCTPPMLAGAKCQELPRLAPGEQASSTTPVQRTLPFPLQCPGIAFTPSSSEPCMESQGWLKRGHSRDPPCEAGGEMNV